MSAREYIGARYVPVFADPIQWDPTLVYEPLTVVTNLGASYVSRRMVPEGIQLDNTDYWVLWADFNAQLQHYIDEVNTFDGRIDALEDALPIADFSSQSTVSDAISAIQGKFPVATADIANGAIATAKIANNAVSQSKLAAGLLNDYEYFKGYNVVFIGDSYTYGTGCSDHLSGDTKRFSTLLAGMLEATEFNYGVGSTGFCDPGSGGQNAPFPTQVNSASAGMTDQQKADTHLVVIAGGLNDFNEGTYSQADMTTAANNACDNALSAFPNALILVVPMLFCGAGWDPRGLNYENAIINGVNGTSKHKRCVYIKGAWTWNFGMATHSHDALHPNDLGHRNIAARIYANIFGGSAYEDRLCAFDLSSGYSASVAQGGYQNLINGVVNMFGTDLQFSSPLTANTNINIGKCHSAAVPLVNVCGQIMKSNANVGTWQITGSGNIYVRVTTTVSGDCFLEPLTYIPSGTISY